MIRKNFPIFAQMFNNLKLKVTLVIKATSYERDLGNN
jgi:hypothetical protein